MLWGSVGSCKGDWGSATSTLISIKKLNVTFFQLSFINCQIFVSLQGFVMKCVVRRWCGDGAVDKNSRCKSAERGEEGTWGEGGVEELLVERTKGIKRKCKKTY